MYNYVLFWISYLLFALQLIWFWKGFFRDTPSRASKTRPESRETDNAPVRLKWLSDRSKTYIYVNSLPSSTLWIFLRSFDFSFLQTSGRYLLTSALNWVLGQQTSNWKPNSPWTVQGDSGAVSPLRCLLCQNTLQRLIV